MKKLLNISVIAALAILPLAANAADLTSEQLAKANIDTADATTFATSGYVKGAYAELGAAINTKQDKLEQAQLDAIAGVSGLTTRVGNLETTVAAKANSADVYTKTAADEKFATQTALAAKANSADVYTKTEVDSALDAKADATDLSALQTTVAAKANSADVYTKTEANTLLDAKADATDLSALQTTVAAKANSADVYTKTEVDNSFAKKTGVTATITASSVTVPALTTWGSNTSTNVPGSITGATYRE